VKVLRQQVKRWPYCEASASRFIDASQCSSQFPFADDRFAFTFDAYFAAKHIPSQIALK
jgi:hypothetical protein